MSFGNKILPPLIWFSKSQVLGIFKTSNLVHQHFWYTFGFGTRLGGSLAPTRVSKPMVFSTASSGNFQN